jgi:hypothetical protein
VEIRWRVLVTLLYPLSIAAVSAGLMAFAMILVRADPLLIGAVVLWFYFISTILIYVITKEALKAFRMKKLFLGMMSIVGALAALASLLILLGFG